MTIYSSQYFKLKIKLLIIPNGLIYVNEKIHKSVIN